MNCVLCFLTSNHLSFTDESFKGESIRALMIHLPERIADAVGCAGSADCSGGWACRWVGLEE